MKIFMMLVTGLLLSACNSKPSADIVTTIKPLYMLTRALAGEHLTVAQLIPDGASPHHYALKPSNIRQLQQAKLILRIDESLEQFLNKALQQLPADIPQLALSQVGGIQLREINAHAVHVDHLAEQAHHHDLHIWLDPDNAIAMSRAITDQLKKVDPQHHAAYASNLQQLITKIRAVDQRLKDTLSPIQNTPILVFHNAWGYFEAHYGITQVNTMTMQATQQLSLAKMQSIRATIQQKNIACLINEQYAPMAMVDTLSQQEQLKVISLDVLGTHIPISNNSYIELLEHTAQGFLACQ
jgi:zinc transport system substrate-binding protein